jgi:hypothetical protein
MKFRDFILEATEKHAVMAFGRMNPPTTGHAKLVDKVKEVAADNNASHHVVLSHSQDPSKNPLSAKDKLKHAKRFFPNTNLSTSDSEHPTFLHHAAKLHQQGVTHLHMVAGSDRAEEYKKKLAQYNGKHKGALFNFKKITVHSSGERDPDAEGTEGMSASKMRGHAGTGNFKEFKKGIPSHVQPHHAKELYNDVRKHMGIKESVDELFEEILEEGVHDKGIFKAVFLAGGPGSGKDYVLDNTLAGHGMTEINSDKALEFLMDKKGLDKTMPASEKVARDVERGKAKNMTELRQRLALHGRNGIIVNGTGDDAEKIKKIKSRLEELGYDTAMIMVNTRDEVSASRNVERGQRGGRSVPESIRKQKWQSVQDSRADLAKLFGDKYVEFDNSEDLRSAKPEIVQAKKEEMLNIYKGVQKFIKTPPKAPQAKDWIGQELEKSDKLPVNTKVDSMPHSNSGAAQEARQMGLQYYGFGRYGKDGKVTYRSVHDKLQQVNPDEPKATPMQSKPVAKKVNEEFESFLKEAVTITIKADTPEEAAKTVKMLTSNEEADEVEESQEYYFSNPLAQRWLTLGKGMVKEELLTEASKPSALDRFRAAAAEREKKHDEIEAKRKEAAAQGKENMSGAIDRLERHLNRESKEIDQKNLLKDHNGKTRTFMLRRSAAKEAHINGGVVYKQGKGYVIKIKENEDVESTIKPIQEQRSRNTSSSTRTNRISEGADCECETGSDEENRSGKTKITLNQIRSKKKEVEESIDKGIEPGMSMAAGGESIGRDMGEKIKKRKISVTEMQGDETTASIGDKKEDELKKKGIDLLSFRKRNYAL